MWLDPVRFQLIWQDCLLIFTFFFGMCVFVCADKDRELGEALAEIKALRFSERLREKAVEEV